MNWWNANHYCLALGTRLVTQSEFQAQAYDMWAYDYKFWGWTSTDYTGCTAIRVRVPGGEIADDGKTGNENMAVCK